ncbi:MAG: class I SAM-dependent methyltransferase [Sphingobium sp.]|nr:class I SAM-dependent methyltransferase [Sphingobium sp.]
MSDIAMPGMNVEDWSGEQGRLWLANLSRFEGMIAPVGTALIDHAQFRPGENVVDLGCGGGGTTIAIARCVSPGGSATGLDISQDLIDHAGIRGRQEAQSGLHWVCADAATIIPANAPFDRLFSRFGSMFFPDPKAGFRNLRRMLKDGGRMDLAVWAPQAENEWIRLIGGVAVKHLPDLPKPDPRAPGPFALADTAWFTEVLEQANFGRISIEPFEATLAVGGVGATPEEAAAFVVSSTHMGRLLQEAGPAAVTDLAAAFAPHYQEGKGTLIGGKAWIVTAWAV